MAVLLSRRGDSKIAFTAIIDRTIVAENPEGGESPNKKDGSKTILLSRRGDSNARPLRPERSALPTALLLARFARFDYLLAQIFSSRFSKAGAKVLLFSGIRKFFCNYFALFRLKVRFPGFKGSDCAIICRTSASVIASALLLFGIR